MKIKLNKKGTDKIISVYWFVILFIVAAGIAYMVFSFYGKPYDIREMEANALIDRVADCVSQKGNLREGVLTEGFKENLNFKVEDVYDWKNEEQYYVEIDVLDFNSKVKISEASAGNSNLKEFCELKGVKLPFCLKRSLYVLGSGESQQQTQYQINILSIVRKTDKNVQ